MLSDINKNIIALCLLLLISVNTFAENEAASVDEEGIFTLRLGPEAYHNSLFRNNSVALRPKLSVDYTFLNHLIFLGEFTKYSIPYGPAHLVRQELSLGLGYRFLENRLIIGPVLTNATSRYERYDDGGVYGYGIRALYKFPIGASKFSVYSGAGFDYQKAITLTRDTGVPSTTDSFSNSLCAAFSFGLANDCGNIFQKLTIPSARQYFLSVQLAYSF